MLLLSLARLSYSWLHGAGSLGLKPLQRATTAAYSVSVTLPRSTTSSDPPNQVARYGMWLHLESLRAAASLGVFGGGFRGVSKQKSPWPVLLCKAEVDEVENLTLLGLPASANEEVVRLDVAMNKIFGVEVFYPEL